MKLAYYYDLPFGGAHRHTRDTLKKLSSTASVTEFVPAPPSTSSRVIRDLQAFFWSRREAKRLAKIINAKFDAAYVTHDRFFQAPWILRYLTVPTTFFCQEPTRAFFEPELGIDSSWPFLNRLYERSLRWLKRHIEIDNAHHAKRIIVNSRYSQRVVKRTYRLNASIRYPLTDPALFRPLSLRRLRQILFVGNDEPQKRLPLAIRAVAQLPLSSRPKLVVVSPRTTLSTQSLALAKKLGVTLISHVGISDQALVKLYNRSRLTLATSLREPFGYSVVESLACGTPVVAVNEGGFRETIRPGVDGYLAAPTPAALARGLNRLLSSPPRKYHPQTIFVKTKSVETIHI